MSTVGDCRRRRPRRVGDVAAFGGALLLYAFFYLGFFAESLRGPNEIAPGDALDFGLATFLSPTRVWTDAMYSGYPIMADPQALSWYPIFQLMRALGFSWTLFEIAGYVIASATAFLLIRRITTSTIAGFFSGIVFGFSGIMLAHINHFNQVHAAAWLPLVVYGLLLIRGDRYREGAAVGALAVGLMWSAGHPQLVVYGAYLCAALVAAWLWIDRPSSPVARRRLLWWGVAAALGVALAGVLILPAAELGALSRRAERDWNLFIGTSLPPAQLLTLVFPMSFGGFSPAPGVVVPYAGAASLVEMGGYAGLLPLALALLAIVAQSPWRRDARVWAVLSIAALMLCVGPATPLASLFFFAPGYASFRAPVRHLFIVAFCVSVASGIGLAEFMRSPMRHWRIICAALAAIVVAGLIGAGLLSATNSVHQVAQHPLYLRWAIGLPLATGAVAAGIVWAGANLVSKQILAAAGVGLLLLVVHLGDMLVVHYVLPGYHLGYANVGPQLWQIRPEMAALRDELRRSGGRALAADGSHNPLLRPNLTRAWQVPAASGSGSLAIERYVTMLRMGGPGDVSPDVMQAEDRSLDLFAIEYVLIPVEMPGVDDLRRQPSRWEERATLKPDYLLFQNSRSLSRAWCVPEIVRTDDALGAIRSGRLSNGRTFEPTEVALVDLDALPQWSPAGGHAQSPQVNTRRVPGSEGEYEVDAGDGECLLVMSEVHYPWWRVSIDGEPAALLRVNYTMVGVAVPRGRHMVRLWLEPRSAWIGGAISAAALLAWTILAGSCVRWNGLTRFEESNDAGPSADTRRNLAGSRPEISLHQTTAT